MTGNNNDYMMQYVGGGGTLPNGQTIYDSSTAQVVVPPGATVRWAGLYWGATPVRAATARERRSSPAGPIPLAPATTRR